MDKIQNWDDINETSYISEEGKYTLKIVEVAKDSEGNITQISANGKEFHKYVCETRDGQRITLSLYLVDNALWKYKAFVKACGLPATGIVNFNELPKSLVGRKFIGEVKRQPDRLNVTTGEMEQSKYFNVEKFYPISEDK